MTNKVLLGATFAAVFTVSMMLAPASAVGSFLDFTTQVKSDDNELKAKIHADADIPKDGTGGAFGYGIITDTGLEAILVTTTHAGVQDSIEQDGASDAEWHNHYVSLIDSTTEGTGYCPGLEVENITWDAPGDVWVNADKAVFDGPKTFESTHSLSGADLEFEAGDIIGLVVSFTIDPVDDSGATITDIADLASVCINDVQEADSYGAPLGKGNAKN